MITKKNYIRIAKEIKETTATKEMVQFTLRLMNYFKEDNPKFNDQKFLRACKL